MSPTPAQAMLRALNLDTLRPRAPTHKEKPMKDEDFDNILRRTLDDGKLSRGERRVLESNLEGADDATLARLRARAFEVAREATQGTRQQAVLGWLEDVNKVLLGNPVHEAPPQPMAESFFSPGDDCRNRLIGLIQTSRRAMDVCVFTITDNDIAQALHGAHQRGVAVRIITDNDKSEDRGSDIFDLERAGVPVLTDETPFHMHHKYAIFDGKILVTGSYNWTRSAAQHNEENILVTDDPRFVRDYQRHFEDLWTSLAR